MAVLLLVTLLQGAATLIQHAINPTARKAQLNSSNKKHFFSEMKTRETSTCTSIGKFLHSERVEAVCSIKVKLVCVWERENIFTVGTPGSTLHLLVFPFSKHGRRTKVSEAFLLLVPFHLGTMETCTGRETQHVGLLICRWKLCRHDVKQVTFQFSHHYQYRGEDSEQHVSYFMNNDSMDHGKVIQEKQPSLT